MIGKIYDHYKIQPGGRVDQYWRSRIDISMKYLRGRNRSDQPEFYDPEKTIQVFDLYSIEFGNWMNQDDRANFLYNSVQSLKDLASCLNIRQHSIGFGGALSLALGARGKGGPVAAFFSPTHDLINLTKTMGSGALAHEYAHAMDMTMGSTTGQGMASGGHSVAKQAFLDHPKGSIEYLFEKVFDLLYWDNGKATKFQTDIKKYPEYWQRRAEVWARTFEVFITLAMKRRQLSNTFLVSPGDYKIPAYPSETLVRKASPTISQLIKKAYE